MEEPKQEAAAPAMLKKKKEETGERELLSFAREMGRREREKWIPRELGKEIMFRMC